MQIFTVKTWGRLLKQVLSNLILLELAKIKQQWPHASKTECRYVNDTIIRSSAHICYEFKLACTFMFVCLRFCLYDHLWRQRNIQSGLPRHRRGTISKTTFFQ